MQNKNNNFLATFQLYFKQFPNLISGFYVGSAANLSRRFSIYYSLLSIEK